MSKAKPRMLIIGSRGFLGGHAMRAAIESFDVVGGNRSSIAAQNEVPVDVRNDPSVRAAFQATKPDVVLLFAAMSDIDRCEQLPEEAFAINVRGVEHVVNACVRSNVRLLFTSSSAVFDGRSHGYTEQSPTSPVSVYGKTKAQGEELVLGMASQGIVLRIALGIGFAGRAGTNSLLDNLQQRWQAGTPVHLPTFEYRNPIDAFTLSRFVLELIKQADVSGIFHAGAADSISRYDLGLKFAARMGYSGLVQPQCEPTRGRAPRGPDHFLLTDKIRQVCTTAVPTCEQVIERCFNGIA